MRFDITKLVYTWFYVGLSPIAPGTFGTVAAIPLLLFMSNFTLESYVIFTIQLFLLGIFAAEEAEVSLWRSDPKEVVIDEVVGYLITMMNLVISWKSLLCGFFIFRVLDIFKPFPISWCDQKFKGGFGIMLDDVLAGMLACSALHLLAKYISF